MKHTLHKTLAVLPLAAACAVFGTSAQAQQQITFNGKVAKVSCTPQAPAGNSVNLPVVQTSDFNNNVAGETAFSFSLVDCGPNPSITAKLYFYNDTPSLVVNDRLELMSGGSGSGWQYELLPRTGATPLKVGTSATVVESADDEGVGLASGSGILEYRVRYYSSAPDSITAGTGSAQATYVMYYN